MRTKIISAFSGTGKSYYHNNHPTTTLDSDSSGFSWSKDENGNKIRNPEFPQNYINHIKENIGKYEIIFVSSHKEVRDALLNNCLYFYLIYPEQHRKDEYIKRYIERGDPQSFINLIETNWRSWINELENLDEWAIFHEPISINETITTVLSAYQIK